MIANLYVDHLLATPPVSSQEVWNQTQAHAKLFSDAASRIGLTPQEYREFRRSLLEGKALYVRLPKRLDAMSGDRRGSVYAVKNAVINQRVMGWRVRLADGNTVFVPQLCGNISLLKHRPVIAAMPKVPTYKVAAAHKSPSKFHPAVAVVPKQTVVALVPPPPPAELPPAAPTVAQVVPVVGGRGPSGFFLLLPLLGGLIGSHGGSPSGTCVPPIDAILK